MLPLVNIKSDFFYLRANTGVKPLRSESQTTFLYQKGTLIPAMFLQRSYPTVFQSTDWTAISVAYDDPVDGKEYSGT